MRLLLLWRANIDVQPVVSAVGVAMYISKYTAKSEPSQVQRAITEALTRLRERGGNIQQQVFAVQSALLNHRQVSASECAYRLCHLKLRDSSRKCVFVNTCKPQERYRMLRFDTDCPEPFKNIFERYENRPRNLEYLSLGEFAVTYEPLSSVAFYEDNNESAPIITLLNRMGRMKKRSKPAVLRTRYYTAVSDPEAYYYSLLVAHCPFRAEEELLTGYDNAKEAFLAKRNTLRPLQRNCSIELMNRWEEEIQDAIRRVTVENAAELCVNNVNTDLEQPNILDPETHIYMDIPDVDNNVTDPIDTVMADEDFLREVQRLNIDQRRLFSLISQKLGNDCTNTSALRLFITGGAGSGKSFTLKLLVEQIRRLSADRHSVVIAAPTGVAARLVGGCTLHSTFSLPIEKVAYQLCAHFPETDCKERELNGGKSTG
ncbi:uncharacterized protein LOC123876493 [Maniola jurtina]|uniref:uncharacterized protein LOC123876493 n=1 Tax=Maniola jurtina TaxID=191418 RepID=UPI001E68C3B3|nr:uncharacterized protein LOC123876493 [Maniola jurtina]